ncbi:hypothetical protein K457DRAFT_29302 [Linnemannia elongata AG-77]|uniref:Nuclear rim protein 1 n=1 Tax=Linnemannia elongata AG-77 TaxID=1314771 RepID=A0A197K7C6_9FUNG|nr:hypothetical protein K457DRAFT_29302 [Linnemannia elongata AG-77]
MEQNRRARIVKRAPLYKRIIDAPEDYLTKVENDLRALDWDLLQEGFSWPLAIGLNVLLTSVKMGYWLDDPLANVPTVLKQDRPYYSSKSMRPGFATLLASLQYVLVAISFVNAIWLFKSKKNYTMMHRSLDEPPSSSNTKMVEFQQDESHWSFKFPGKYIYPFISIFMRGPKPEENKRHVWQLSLWNPSILSRNLFCWYSPAQVLILAFMTADNFYVFFPLSIMVAVQVHFLVSVYQSYVKDKEMLFSEVHNEYNIKFVHPIIFVRKYDKQVSTETETDRSDLKYYSYQDHERDQDRSPNFTPERKQRNFRYLSVPASSRGSGSESATNLVRHRKPTAAAVLSSGHQTSARSTSTSSVHSRDEEEDDDEDYDGEEEEEEEEEEGSSEDGSEDEEESDPDVEYDEEGEEPVRPHPTNSLSSRNKLF